MRELDPEMFIIYGIAILCIIIATPFVRTIPRNRGTNLVFHVLYISVGMIVILFVPDHIQDEIFSQGGVLLLGTFIPLRESISVACSFGEDDDDVWLLFWITSSVFMFGTEFMDDIEEYFPQVADFWFTLEFFVLGWIMFPLTDGAALLYDQIIVPFLSTNAKNLQAKLEGWMVVAMTLVNATSFWVIWFVFMDLPEEARRFLVVAMGTIYPIVASITAVAINESDEYRSNADNYWLIYWICFHVLFACMDYLENFVGEITGFYSICMACTIYLSLPMFRGADVIFRKVIVPLCGYQHELMLRDVYNMRLNMERSIPEAMKEKMLSEAADLFTKELKTKSKNKKE